jgi:GntR family histidine utilization transcriptional repressor
MPDSATRALLAIPAAEPVLHVRRRTWSGGAVVSTARLVHPGSRYSLFGRFRVARNQRHE